MNFAVAGASALNYSALAMKDIVSLVTNSSLDVQLDWFKSHLNSTFHSISGKYSNLKPYRNFGLKICMLA